MTARKTRRSDAPIEKVSVPSGWLAERLGLTDARIRQLVNEEGFPRTARGQYPAVAFLLAFIAFQERQLARRELPDDLHALQKRKLELQVDQQQLELDKAKGLLVATGEFERTIQDMLARFRAKALTMRGEYASRVIGLRTMPEAQSVLDEIGRALIDAMREDLTREGSWDDGESS